MTLPNLPPGLELGDELPGAGVFGRVFVATDRRLGGDPAPKKVVRILPNSDHSTAWEHRFRARLSKLSGLSLAHVSLPVESIEVDCGQLVLVTPRLGESLASRIGGESGAAYSTQQADEIVRGLLTALAGLHAEELAHGDVRPQNVLLANLDSDRPVAWLIDAAVGPLTWYSGGHLRDPGAHHYYPPEWQGQTREPTAQADLYALGVSLVELFCGRQANSLRRGNESDAEMRSEGVSQSPSQEMIERLARSHASPATRQLVVRLLSDLPEERLANGNAALRYWEAAQKTPWWRTWIRDGIWLLMAITAAILLVAVVRTIWDYGALKRELDESRKTQQDTLAEVDKLRRQQQDIGAIDRRIRDLAGGQIDQHGELVKRLDHLISVHPKSVDPPPSTPQVSDPEARQVWGRLVEKVETAKPSATSNARERVERLNKELTDAFGKDGGVPEKARKKVEEWQWTLRKFLQPPWWDQDSGLHNLLWEWSRQPWDRPKPQGFDERIARLDAAATRWKVFARDDTLTWEDLRQEILMVKNDEEQKILQGWYEDTKNQAPRGFTLLLLTGSSADWGSKERSVYLDIGGAGARYGWHSWSSSTSHTYAKNSTLNFVWKPGQPIRFYLEAGRAFNRAGLYNPNILDQSISGPLAPWRAHYEGKVEQGESALWFDIPNCAGPHRKAFPKPVAPAAGALLPKGKAISPPKGSTQK